MLYDTLCYCSIIIMTGPKLLKLYKSLSDQLNWDVVITRLHKILLCKHKDLRNSEPSKIGILCHSMWYIHIPLGPIESLESPITAHCTQRWVHTATIQRIKKCRCAQPASESQMWPVRLGSCGCMLEKPDISEAKWGKTLESCRKHSQHPTIICHKPIDKSI